MRWRTPLRRARCLRLAAAARPAAEELEPRTLLSFTGPLNYSWGWYPTAQVVGDFNGDGSPDVAAASRRDYDQTHALAVLLNAGDGTLQDALVWLQPQPINELVKGDFNGDTILDVAYSHAGGLTVLLGWGNGAFQEPRAAAIPSVSVAADFNGDGLDDLARPGQVYLSNGDGTFRLSGPLQVPFVSGGLMVAGDFNGDSRLDLAVANPGVPPFPPPGFLGTAYVALGNGDGTFGAARLIAQFDRFSRVAGLDTGDFTGDGRLDVVVLIPDSGLAIRGNGDGTFQPPIGLPQSSLPTRVDLALADFNGDSRADLAIATGGYGSTEIYLSNGDGTFTARPLVADGPETVDIAAVDVDGDSRLDLVAAHRGGGANIGSWDVSVRRGAGDGFFDTGLLLAIPSEAQVVVAGDVNGDAKPDLVSANTLADSVSVLLNNGDGTFQPPQNYAAGGFPFDLHLADFNGDHALDVVVVNQKDDTVMMLLNNGDGTFRSGPVYQFSGPYKGTVGDFNGDRLLDFALTEAAAYRLTILLGNGDGSFRPGVSIPVGDAFPRTVSPADFNGDGALDLVVTYRGQYLVEVYLGNGDGTFRMPLPLSTGPRPGAVAVADFNRDGKADLALADDGLQLIPGATWVYLGNGDGTFQFSQLLAVGSVSFALTAADFDNDGLPDLAVAARSGVKVLWGNGDGTFREATRSYGAASAVSGLTAADLDGDGWIDMAMSSRQSDIRALSLHFNRGGRSGRHPDSPPVRGNHDAQGSALDQFVLDTLRPSGDRKPSAVRV